MGAQPGAHVKVDVATASGGVRGEQRGAHQRFLGIRYAEAPVGARRFGAPVPAAPWVGVREAATFGASAPQPVSLGVLPVGRQDEDCLFLNVYTPAADGQKRPVMCFVHGGAFYLGSGSEATYDGGPLAERGDVVVVTLNYRLGVLGFLDLRTHAGEAWGATPNAGLLDQVCALRWVQAHIAAFGGDPDNVTVFGESAGATSVCALLAVPEAEGLFCRAIAQSGHANSLPSGRVGADKAGVFLKALGLDRADPDALKTVPVARLLEAQAVARGGDLRAVSPIVDGELVPRSPLAHVREGGARGVPLMLGSNRDEMNLFLPAKRDPIDHATLLRRAGRLLPKAAADDVDGLLETYRKGRQARGLPHENLDLLDALTTSTTWRLPALELALAQAAHQPQTFVYEFEWRSPARRGAMGAAHAVELPFVFGTVGKAMPQLTGTGPEAEALSAKMMDAWLAFARSGNPSCEAVGTWSPYLAETRPTMIFDAHTRLEHAPLEAERAHHERLRSMRP